MAWALHKDLIMLGMSYLLDILKKVLRFMLSSFFIVVQQIVLPCISQDELTAE